MIHGLVGVGMKMEMVWGDVGIRYESAYDGCWIVDVCVVMNMVAPRKVAMMEW